MTLTRPTLRVSCGTEGRHTDNEQERMTSVLVRGFIRKLRAGSRASAQAQEAAYLAGVHLSEGYTYVGPHMRSPGLHLLSLAGHAPEDDIPPSGTWVEVRYLVRWRDITGRKHSKFLSAHSGQKHRKEKRRQTP
jgi:hypothetical protein